MELKKALEEFLYHKIMLENKLFHIFVPIIYEVKLQDTKSLLFPPIHDSFAVKWRVKNPRGVIPTSYPYLIFGFNRYCRFKKQEIALYACQKAMHHDLYFEFFMDEYYKAAVKSVDPSSFDDMLEEIKPFVAGDENDDLFQLEKFSLAGEIDAAAVAKRIVTEAQRIYREQKKIGEKKPKTEKEWEEFAENQP